MIPTDKEIEDMAASIAINHYSRVAAAVESAKWMRDQMTRKEVKVTKSLGWEEAYYEKFECPNCERKCLSEADNYCYGCGSKLNFEL